jgi:hypothetical protein
MRRKFHLFGLRLLDFILLWPHRVLQLFRWLFWLDRPRGRHVIWRWLIGLMFCIIDLTPLAVLVELIVDLLKKETRGMSAHEIEVARSIYGDAIKYNLVGMDPDSNIARGKRIAFVSLQTIRFAGDIADASMIHELMHIWQYRRYGSLYMSESLHAQHWGGGYDYGGLEVLKRYSEGQRLRAFNFEQQGEIIEDYFRWKNSIPMLWMVNVPGVGHVLEQYVAQVRK